MAFVTIAGNEVPTGAEVYWLEGRGGVKLRVMTAPADAGAAVRGSVIIAPGRTEFLEKYFEAVRELQSRGFNVFCIDWRGQGLSGREVENAQKGHFHSFDDPVNDLAAALKMLADKLPRPHIGLAHSMGGAILLRGLQTRRIELDGAVFSSPMWGIAKLGDFAKSYARFMTSVGAGAMFAPSVATKWKREGFKRNPVTYDRARHTRSQDIVDADRRLALAGPTLSWVAAAVEATEGFTQPRALAHVRMPVLIVSAGDEVLVDNASHETVAAQLPNVTHITIPGAKHEILMERDPTRAQFWAAFDALAERVAPARITA